MKITEYKKKDGTIMYRSQIYLGLDQVTGKKARTSVSGRTKKELKNNIKLAKYEFQANGETVSKVSNIKTYRELAMLWWDSYKHTVKPNSVITIRGLLNNHLLPLFGDISLDKLTTPMIQEVINDLADKTNRGVKGAFLHYDMIHSFNKRILQYGVTMQVLKYNIARDVVLPRNTKKGQHKVKHFENENLKKFMDHLDSLDSSIYRNIYEATLYKLLLATGCRISEALALSWSDIDFDNATVSITKTLNRNQEVNPPKTKTSLRLIDIDDSTVTMLKEYKKRQTLEAWQLGRSEKVVFSNFITQYPNYNSLTRALSNHFKKAKVPNIGFHGFRHTHASLLLNAGIPYKQLQNRLGHSTLAMTMDTYGHLSKENAKQAVSFYENAIKAI